MAVPAVIGAGAALGVMGATVGFGGDTTIIRESSTALTTASSAGPVRPAEAGAPPGAALGVA